MVSWDGLNRRRFPRVIYPCLVVVRGKNQKEEIFLTHTENVGTGGICVILKKSLKLFSEIEMELDLLDLGAHIKCRGKIVWSVQRKGDAKSKPSFYDVGIEVLDIKESERQRLEKIVSRLEKTSKNIPYAD